MAACLVIDRACPAWSHPLICWHVHNAPYTDSRIISFFSVISNFHVSYSTETRSSHVSKIFRYSWSVSGWALVPVEVLHLKTMWQSRTGRCISVASAFLRWVLSFPMARADPSFDNEFSTCMVIIDIDCRTLEPLDWTKLPGASRRNHIASKGFFSHEKRKWRDWNIDQANKAITLYSQPSGTGGQLAGFLV